jgi:hypothetical protein
MSDEDKLPTIASTNAVVPIEKSGLEAPRERIRMVDGTVRITEDSVWVYSDWLGEWVRDESLDHLTHDGSLPDAPKRLKHDLQIVLDWLGVNTVNEVGIAQKLQWTHAREEHSRTGRRTSNPLGPTLTDEIHGVFARMEEARIDRFFADDESSRLEQIAKWRAAEVSPGLSINAQRNGKTHSSTSDYVSMVLGMKGIVGFVSGFILMFGLELLLFSGMESLSGHRLRAVGAGWIVMPFIVGCGGWTLFRVIDFSKVIGGCIGGVIGAAIVFVQQLFQSERAR